MLWKKHNQALPLELRGMMCLKVEKNWKSKLCQGGEKKTLKVASLVVAAMLTFYETDY